MHTSTAQLDQEGGGHVVMMAKQEVFARGYCSNIPELLKECSYKRTIEASSRVYVIQDLP